MFYVVGYTMILKRRTTQNIVWGGAAGCFPALIGWTAVTNELAWTPVVLFLVVFFWTPPHFWALAMRYRDDYAAAGVPMLPSVATSREVAQQIVTYSWVMVLTSIALWPIAVTGWFYPGVAIIARHRVPRRGLRPPRPVARQRGAVRHQADAVVPPLQRLPRAALRRRGRRPLPPVIPADWEPHHRDDGELIGYVVAEENAISSSR